MWQLVIGPFDSEADALAWRDRHLPAVPPEGKRVTAIGGNGEETVEVLWGPAPDGTPPGSGEGAPA